MKIKNFKIDQKVSSKLATCVLIGSLAATTLTGCGDVDRNNLLKGTILENTVVVTFDNGSKDIAVAISNCNSKEEYHHYYSIISGEYFGSLKCTKTKINNTVSHHYGITSEENISGYLTSDDITKAMKGELNNNDIIAIINRAIESTETIESIESTNEETNVKTR